MFTEPNSRYFSALDGSYIEPRVTTRDVEAAYEDAVRYGTGG